MVSETYVNADKGYVYIDNPPYESYTNNMQRLFLNLQREFGRCVSKMYVDCKDGSTKEVGYVFQKRVEYDDPPRYNPYGKRYKPKTYTQEVWVQIAIVPYTEEE